MRKVLSNSLQLLAELRCMKAKAQGNYKISTDSFKHFQYCKLQTLIMLETN